MRWIAAVLVAAVVVPAGAWVTGGLLTDDAFTAKALTGAWFGLCGLVALAVAFRRRTLAVPVLVAYTLVTGLVGGTLLYTSTVDKTVREEVVTAEPAPEMEMEPQPMERTTAAPGTTAPPATSIRPTAPVLLARGSFTSGEHETTGTASVIRRPNGSLVLTLTDLDTSPGPDLRVQLDGRDLGKLKGNRGTQQYEVPAGGARFGQVVIWCRAFSVSFGTAKLVTP